MPAARAIHHEQLSTDRSAGARRVVEFHRNRDLYMRKHHGAAAAAVVRGLTALSYVQRALAALVLSGHDPHWYLLHARKALRPSGLRLREADTGEPAPARLGSGIVAPPSPLSGPGRGAPPWALATSAIAIAQAPTPPLPAGANDFD